MTNRILKSLVRPLRRFALKGDDNHCPICGGHFITFLPYGVCKRPNAACPDCSSLERQRLIWLFVQKRRLFSCRIKLLHVSPEKVLFNKFSQDPKVEYVPIDKFDPGYHYPKGTENVDITAMPYPDHSFDAIICIHVLEHVPEDALAMRELRRVLKPSGWAIIQVPLDQNRKETYEDFSITDPKERVKAFGQRDHVRWYGLDYRKRLEQAGFTVEVVDYAGSFSTADQFKYGLRGGDDIYFCSVNE